jgi:hypothetical protein
MSLNVLVSHFFETIDASLSRIDHIGCFPSIIFNIDNYGDIDTNVPSSPYLNIQHYSVRNEL